MAEYVNAMNFTGGVNNSVADELIPDGSIADARNVVPNTDGSGNLVKRYAYEQHLDGVTGKVVKQMFSGKLNRYYTAGETGTAKDFVIYDLDNEAELYSHTDPASEAYFASLNGVDYVNGGIATTHELQTTDGTTWTPWTGPTAGSLISGVSILATYNNMLWATSRFQPIKLAWSAVSDGSSWSATQTLELDTGSTMANLNGGSALIPFRDRLVVFGQSSMFHVHAFGATDTTIPFSRRDIGCIGPRAALDTPFGLIWWSAEHGIVISRDGYNIEFPMLTQIPATFATARLYQTYLMEAIYRPDLRCARFFVPLAALDRYDTRIDYYPETDTFWIQTLEFGTTTQQGSLVTLDNSFAVPGVKEYIGYGIKVMKEGTGVTENGTVLTSYVKTKRYSQGTPLALKTSRQLMVTSKLASAGNLTVDMYQDNATSATRTTTITPGTGVQDTLLSTNLTHKKIQFKITDAIAGRNELFAAYESGTIQKTL